MKQSLSLVLAAFALAIAGATWYRHSSQLDQLQSAVATLQADVASLRTAGGAGPAAEIDVAKVPFRGSPDAVVTLVEFSDYECPFCVRHFQQTMPSIDRNYIQTGKIRYVFRDFPIDSNHPAAIKAHEAAHCAIEQNKFWELHNRLFSAPGTHTPALLEQRATEAGLNLAAYRACVAAGKVTAAVRESGSIAEQFGADGTPAFFIGIRDKATDRVRIVRGVKGAVPYEQFAAALDAVIAGAK